MGNSTSHKEPTLKHCTLAFYNLENLFDAKDDPHTLDDDFTPKGFKRWKAKRYHKKLAKLSYAIARIGEAETALPPVLVGVAEVENRSVIQKLLQTPDLNQIHYDFVHFDSPDERGIDTALIYHRDYFKVTHSETMPLIIENQNGERDFTRDVLYVQGELQGETLHVFINHWPSRRDGAEHTEYKRIKAAELILNKVKQLEGQHGTVNVVVMGDFNDDPQSKSIRTLMAHGSFINPFEKLLSPYTGSANYKGKWSLFDQILISHSFLNYQPASHTFSKADIFNPDFLQEWKGRYKGRPFRSFAGKKYLGGYSDHFPVYVVLQFNM